MYACLYQSSIIIKGNNIPDNTFEFLKRTTTTTTTTTLAMVVAVAALGGGGGSKASEQAP